MKHIIDENQFDISSISDLIHSAQSIIKGKPKKKLKNKVMATLFYEPSTRTRLSFESAMFRLGGKVISTENASQFSSAIKGESLEDTIKVVSSYSDVIVLRHFDKDASFRASEVSSVPVINAGSGNGSHPTQSLLDVLTIFDEMKTGGESHYQTLNKLSKLHYCFVGDLLHSRTIKSLVKLLINVFSVKNFTFIGESLDDDILELMQKKSVEFTLYKSFYDLNFESIDVFYLTRLQKERRIILIDIPVFEPKFLNLMKKEAIIMHPLPRTNELPIEIDQDPRAVYFKQAENGLYLRMALLSNIFREEMFTDWSFS